ncbi:MAG: TDP-4-keto-6-deoxy-D-glucose transaminase, partial [Clostridia bacterium]|nr:TDP-4-keto-6-deoxy-D-glucose transaminase [Clostridia bacterium]
MIPYHKIYKSDEEENYICDALARRQISGDGYYTKLVEDFLQKCFHLNKVLMTTSATHALELAMLLIDLKSGDEVIMPSFTFSSTANAVLLRGAKPVFAEIDRQTLNLDPQSVHSRITKKTRAIIPVHYAGISCNMDALMDLAKNQKIYVIEDAAQAVNAKYRGKYLGGIGHMGCYSFHGTKN